MALLYKNINLISKKTFAASRLSIRLCCKLTKNNTHQLVPVGLKLRQYFTSVCKELQAPQRNPKKETVLSYDVNLDFPDDVLLYSDGTKKIEFGMLSIYGFAAIAAFKLIADTILMTIRDDAPVNPLPEGEKISWWRWWRKVDLGTKTVKRVLYYLCMIAGVLICVAAQLYPSRMVSSIYLLRGGRMISWTTYGLLGRLRVKKYPLKHISCESDPSSTDRYMQFKVKGKYLHFLVDKKKGKFYNDRIFKGSVGLRRVWT